LFDRLLGLRDLPPRAGRFVPRWLSVAVLAIALALPAAAMAGPYSRLQVLLPGESPAPGTPSGKTGTPSAQTVGVPFTVTFRACDNTWALATGITDVIQTLSSNANATLPAPTQLSNSVANVTVTFNAGGTFTIQGHDQTDTTIPDGASSPVAALVLQGFVFNTISQKHFTAGVGRTMTLEAVDPSGNRVTGFSGVVMLKETTSFGDGSTSPASITLNSGVWTGDLAALRADETNINRGNCNFYAFLQSAPAKNGTSDPFVVHPGSFTRMQVLVPGETALPGSPAGKTGTPASQIAGQGFTVNVWATDAYWNPVITADNARVSSSDVAANTPLTQAMVNGFAQFNVILNTVGTRTVTASDASNGGITTNTSPGITVIPSGAHHFVVAPIASPQVAGVPVSVTIRAADVSGNTVLGYNGPARLAANTGPGSISPEDIDLTNGIWTGPLTFFGSGGSVSFTCSDFSAPPHTGTSNIVTVNPGPLAGLQVLLPGESARGGTVSGKIGTPTSQSAGTPFNLTVRAVDDYWNLVPGITHTVALGSSDAFAAMPAETTLANGQIVLPVRLHLAGPQRIWASDVTVPAIKSDTSSYVTIVGGSFARVLILAPGEYVAPGTANGRAGTATSQSISYAFTMTALATDAWFNPVTGVNDLVRFSSDDLLATLPGDTALVNGRIDVPVRLARGGYSLISVADLTQPSKAGSSTQVEAISSGFHLEASVTPSTAAAGAPFTLTVKVTNAAGAVIEEVNSRITVQVRNSVAPYPAGRGTLYAATFQLQQGQASITETYTFSEPIQLVVRDDAGNDPAITNVITITPGPPNSIDLRSNPGWVGGNKHATLTAQLLDLYGNGVPTQPMTFTLLAGGATLTPTDLETDGTGIARADYLSPRQPEFGRVRASSNGLNAELDIQTAFVDPNAAGGTVTNYPNPFHPPSQGTTIAYKLADHASVTLRVFTPQGDLVLRRTFNRGAQGGLAGLNEFVWDGKNGDGTLVSSGGYTVLIEAEGTGETLHVMRRKIAVVR